MASVVTNKGKYRQLESFFRNSGAPTSFKLVLITDAVAPVADTNTFSELTQVASGNGYTSGGQTVSRNSTDFDVLTEDDTNDRAYVQLKDFSWTASGGALPGSGSGAFYAVLTDDNATQGSREVFVSWDLGGERVVSDTQTLTLQNCEVRLS